MWIVEKEVKNPMFPKFNWKIKKKRKRTNGKLKGNGSRIASLKKKLYTGKDYRYVYLFYNKKNGKTKIGITNNLKRRESGIESSVEGMDIKLIYSIKVYNAKNIEKHLHYEYHDQLKQDRDGNGRTEWYLLNWWQRECIKWYLRFVWVVQQIQITIIYLTILLLIFSLLIYNI